VPIEDRLDALPARLEKLDRVSCNIGWHWPHSVWPPASTPMSDDEETNERNFYKVEKWTQDGSKVDRLLYAGNNLDKAREIFAKAIKHRPRIRLTIRQRTRVLQEWRS
jgi:hypothetical protein